MNGFDLGILRFLNGFAQSSWVFDKFVVVLSGNQLLKGGVLVAIVWWLWFDRRFRNQQNRGHIIATILGCGVALVLARALAVLLPFRFRPVHNQELDFNLPFGMGPTLLEGWSSFPSDHAVLFFALSAGLWCISRWLGLFAFLYTAIVITFPRIYLGLHYPTDILAGALVGSAVALLANRWLVGTRLVSWVEGLSHTRPQWFYPLFFLLSYQIADMFAASRSIANGMATVVLGGP